MLPPSIYPEQSTYHKQPLGDECHEWLNSEMASSWLWNHKLTLIIQTLLLCSIGYLYISPSWWHSMHKGLDLWFPPLKVSFTRFEPSCNSKLCQPSTFTPMNWKVNHCWRLGYQFSCQASPWSPEIGNYVQLKYNDFVWMKEMRKLMMLKHGRHKIYEESYIDYIYQGICSFSIV